MIFGELELPVDKYLERGLQYMNDNTRGFEQVRMVAASLDELHRTVPNGKKWLEEIRQTRNQDGSFAVGIGRARATALNVVAEMRLGVKTESDQLLRILREGQQEDGGYGNDETWMF